MTDAIRPALTVGDIQQRLGVGRNTALDLMRDGALAEITVRDGRRWSIPADSFDAWCVERGRLAAQRTHRQGTAPAPTFIHRKTA